ncbi:acetyltransferase, GNAT family [Gleimia coleocanis DSM 15436]|uniref:Acetyltransferase, GNAT family n=1 Tax=Gleimia coleocanis DSM 15436 TaxID=525245 RepID=C0W1A9_9ACTO|nr:GNAT family N-acetyltransferase [Gleimia coleocanis]EEH63598.1 acetyltransferase, GNAT family [Gleimia coleocanis DSM 15436]
MSQLTLHSQLETLIGLERPLGIELATLTRYDIPALASLYLVAYENRFTAADLVEAVEEMRMAFNGEFGRPLDNSFVGAWVDGELVGAILLTVTSPWDDLPDGTPIIMDLMVAPEHRGKGIATALVGEIAHRACQAGYETISLRLDLHEAGAAAKLYDSLGFAEKTQN